MYELIKAGVPKNELMGSSWYGFIDLKDKAQMKYFRNYTKKRG